MDAASHFQAPLWHRSAEVTVFEQPSAGASELSRRATTVNR